MQRRIILLFIITIILSGCNLPLTSVHPSPIPGDIIRVLNPMPATMTSTPFLPITNTPTYTPTPTQTFSPTPEITYTLTSSNTPKPKPTKKPKPSSTPTPEWSWQDPGSVTVPILLYHHVVEGEPSNLYAISSDTLREQMDYLHSNGYITIPISLLVKAITEGANLPDRPVVITFDDGNLDVYENAFPILQHYGFTATFYLVLNYLDHSTFISTDQAAELTKAGWEIGSHSTSHPYLAGMDAAALYQVANSKQGLEDAIGVSVDTFSYPFGEHDYYIEGIVKKYYSSAVGLGESASHSTSNLFYLSRLDVRSNTTMDEFEAGLPW